MANIVYTCIELCTALASAIPTTQASPLAAASSSMSCLRKAGSVKGSTPQLSVATDPREGAWEQVPPEDLGICC